MRQVSSKFWRYVGFGVAAAAFAAFLSLKLSSPVERPWEPKLNPPVADAESARIDERHAARIALMEEIRKEYPQLESSGLSDFERVCLLRQWAWSQSDTALSTHSPNLIDQDSRNKWVKLDAPAIFQLFKEDRGGVLCSGAAQGLMRLYEAAGYRAWVVSSGGDNLTHAVTLVEIETSSGPRRCLQDAYFNLTYVDAETREPLDYFELLRRLTALRDDTILRLESDHEKIATWPATIVAAQELADHDAAWFAQTEFTILESNYRDERLPDGSLKITSPRTFGKFLNSFCRDRHGAPQWYLRWIIEQGHPPHMRYLLLYPYDVIGPNQQAVLSMADQITSAARRPSQSGSAKK